MTSVKNYPPRIDRTILDICDCVSKFKEEFQETHIPINDDNVTLHRFCGKLEYVLQLDWKEKTSLLGLSKDYWDYFCKCLATKNKIHDGLRFVKGVSELKTSLGRGRAFIRFCLMHQCLADTLQQCIDNTKVTKSWYGEKALLVNSIQTSCLLSHLYELNEVQFDLSSQGHDLDVAWPSFARKFFDTSCWRPPSRTYSLSSLVSDISVQSEFVASNLSPSKEAACNASFITKEGDIGREKEELMARNLMVASNSSISNSSELEEIDKVNKELAMGNELKLQMEEIMKQFEIKEQNWTEKISDLQSRLDQSKKKLGECIVLIKDQSSEKTVNQSQCFDFLAYCNKILTVTNETVDFMKSELNSDFKGDKEGQSRGKDIGPLFREIDNQIALLDKKAGKVNGDVSAKEHAALMKRLKESLEKLNNIGYEKLLKINKELKRLREKTIDQIDVNNKLDKQLNILTNENEDLKYSLEKSTIEVKDCYKKLEKQEKRREGLEEQVNALKDGLGAAKKMLELKDEVITHLRKDVTTTKTKLMKNEETVKELECKLKAAEADKDHGNANLIGTGQTCHDLQKQVEKGQRESDESIIELNEKLKSSSLLLSQQGEEVTNLKQRLDVSLKENERLSQQMNFLWNLLQQAERRVVYLDCRQMSNSQTDQTVYPQENQVNISEVNDFFNTVNPVLDSVTESSDTLPDPPIIATASRTLSRLHSLIDEKLELQQELESTKEIASSLLNKMAEQEEKLSTVTMELTETQSLMAKLRAAFQKLQTSEAIMRYELKEKRTMLDKLKGQLHNSHAQWEQIRQKNNESEVEWQSLREEFANRRKQGSEESGFSDENGKSEEIEVELDPILSPSSPPQFPPQLPDLPVTNDTPKESESEEVVAASGVTLETSAEANVSEENVIVEETLTTDTSANFEVSTVSEENLSEASTSSIEVQASDEAAKLDVVRKSADARRLRLDRMEEQCKCLYNKLSNNYLNTAALHSRVASLHNHYCGGSSETDSQDADESPETLPTLSSESVPPDLNTAETSAGSEGPDNQMPIVEALLTDLVDFSVQTAEASLTTTLPNDLSVLDVEISDDESHGNLPTSIKPTAFMLAQALPKRIEKLMKEKEELKQEISKLQKEKEEGESMENNFKAQLESVNLEKEELSKKLLISEKQRQEVAVKGLELKKRADFIMKKEKEQNDLRVQQLVIKRDSLQRRIEDTETDLKEQMELIKKLEESLNKSQAELASTKTSQEQQIEALKFQLSTEALKHEKAFKGHSEQETVINSMREQMNQQELLISSLEKELKQIHDGREQEKKNQMIALEELNIALTTRDEECLNLSENLKEVTKRLDEELAKNNQYQNELEKVRASSEETTQNLEKEVSQLQSDSHELKKYIIKLIREKDLLWKQSDKLCHRQKIQASDRWMNDDEVSKCVACKSEFSFTIRKHHCRLCGRIFCYNCCNNWVMTTASSRRARVCNACFIQHSQADVDINSSFLSNDSEDETNGAEAPNGGCCSSTRTESADLPSINSEVTEKDTQKRKDSAMDSLPTSTQDDDDEEFHIISDEEISRSLSGSNPYSSSASDSLESSVMLSTRKTFEDIPSDRETAEAKEIWIGAGKKYLFPVYLEENSLTLFWNFSSEPKSIAFSLTYSEKEGGAEQNLIPTTKCNGHLHPIQGKLLVKRQGLYTLIFDNSFSRFIAKKVTLTVWLKHPKKEESNGENSS